MKRIRHKLFCISLVLCGIPPTLFSQDAYYYYDGEKIPLGVNPSKVSILVAKGENMMRNFLSTKQAFRNYEYIIQNDLFEQRVINLASQSVPNIMGAVIPAIQTLDSSIVILPVYQDNQFEELILTNYLYVKLKKEDDGCLLDSISKIYNIDVIDTNKWMPLWHTLSITPQSTASSLDIANAIFETGLFASAFPDFSYDMAESISDEELNYQWGLYNGGQMVNIGVLDAWKIATGQGVNIAVVDDGINRNHTDLIVNLHALRHDETEVETETHSHGTQCALLIAAAKNDKMMVGVAYNAKLMEAKAASKKNNATSKQLANCINWAWENGADVISCSWEAYKNNMLKDAIDNAIEKGRNGKGAILVNSAGNTGGNVTWPADYRSEILVVSAIDRNGERWQTYNSTDGSSYGEAVDVCAPGAYINTPYNDITYGDLTKSGTSYSCALVAGVAALVLERNPHLTGQQVCDIIEQTANKTACKNFNQNAESKGNGMWNKEYGYGLVNAAAAVHAACTRTTINGLSVINSHKVEGCDIQIQNTSVKNGAKLTVDALEQVTIEGTFEVANGAELEINVKPH